MSEVGTAKWSSSPQTAHHPDARVLKGSIDVLGQINDDQSQQRIRRSTPKAGVAWRFDLVPAGMEKEEAGPSLNATVRTWAEVLLRTP